MTENKPKRYFEQGQIWADAYEDSEGSDLFPLMVKLGDTMEAICGIDATNVSMIALYENLLPFMGMADDDLGLFLEKGWRAVWLNAKQNESRAFSFFDFDTLPVAQEFTALNAFAFGGTCPNELDAPKPDQVSRFKETVGSFVNFGKTFLEVVPSEWSIGGDIRNTVNAASARYKLDELNEDVSVVELAALSQVSEKSIRNILSKKDGTLTQQDGVIPANQATAWLRDRKGYFPSVYDQPEEEKIDGKEFREPAQEKPLDEVVFAPVCKSDGTVFFAQSEARRDIFNRREGGRRAH